MFSLAQVDRLPSFGFSHLFVYDLLKLLWINLFFFGFIKNTMAVGRDGADSILWRKRVADFPADQDIQRAIQGFCHNGRHDYSASWPCVDYRILSSIFF